MVARSAFPVDVRDGLIDELQSVYNAYNIMLYRPFQFNE